MAIGVTFPRPKSQESWLTLATLRTNSTRLKKNLEPSDPTMSRIAAATLALVLSAPIGAACELPDPQQREEQAADTFELSSLEWSNRVFLLFAPSPKDPAYKTQQEAFAGRYAELEERDVVIVTAFADGTGMLDGRPIDQRSVRALRRDLQPRARAYSFVLIGKDGTEKARIEGKPADLDEIFELIDSMPMRQREMKDQEAGK